jgi:hypothetical protein
MECDNCGQKQPAVLVSVGRYRPDGVSHPEGWCLDCVQGKNPVRETYEPERFEKAFRL